MQNYFSLICNSYSNIILTHFNKYILRTWLNAGVTLCQVSGSDKDD
jgi:hypothetical protein